MLTVLSLGCGSLTLAATPGVPILMYHRLGINFNPNDKIREGLTVTPQDFEAQIKYLTEHDYTIIKIDQLADVLNHKQEVKNPVVITFDDGYRDFYAHAFPILKKYNAPATVFVITDLVGDSDYLTWPQIDELNSSGLITFGAHTVHHPDLTRLRADQIYFELKAAQNTLKQHTHQDISFVAYPYGKSNDLVRKIAEVIKFSGAVGTWPGAVNNLSLNMPRVRVSGHESLASFIKAVEQKR